MPLIDLKYGRAQFSLEYDPDSIEVLAAASETRALTDAEIGLALDAPIDSPTLDEIVRPSDTVLLVVPDATRQSGCGQIVNLLVRRLIANGSSPDKINIIFATGIHRRVTDEEKRELLTPFIAQRINTIDHDAENTLKNFRVGQTSGGIDVGLNWRLTEFDHVVIIGSVTFHYFAGFTGGRKLICPGLASDDTIEATHKLAFDCETRDRRKGVGTGLLDGNPVHEAFVEAASMARVSFSVSTIVNDNGAVTDVYCGDWLAAHRKACDAFARRHTLPISQKRPLVVVSCGGYPFDINMIQAHKALDAAASACSEKGTIVLVAECTDGLGRAGFLKWFDSENSDALAARLCTNYEVNGQTAWSLLRKAEAFDVRIVTLLDRDITEKMRLTKIEPEDLYRKLRETKSGYIVPAGSKVRFAN